MSEEINREEVQDVEIKLFVEGVYDRYGYDFRQYAEASQKRRILYLLKKYGCRSVSQLMERCLHDEGFFHRILNDLTITVTELFRDPVFYAAVKEKVMPYIKTYPYIKIWHAGCSTGEEVYSLAILLQEEGLYERCLIYGTDINIAALRQAQKGMLNIDHVRLGTQNYFAAGMKESLNRYVTIKDGYAYINEDLKHNVVFSDHNLVTDGCFGEMQLIFCRNVLIYFKKSLQDHVTSLFYDSLCEGGFLCLGSKETLNFAPCFKKFDVISNKEKIYRKRCGYGDA